MSIFNKSIPLSTFATNLDLVVKSVAPKMKFENGLRTDEIEGQVYEVIDLKSLETFKISVLGQTSPIITNKEIQESEEHIHIEAENPMVKFYVGKNNRLSQSITAKNMEIIISI